MGLRSTGVELCPKPRVVAPRVVPDWRAMRCSAAVAAVLAVALPGCDPPAPGPAPSASATTPPAPSAASPTAAEPAPTPPDLDVAAQQRALKCGGDTKSGACGVVARMASCTPWNAIVPSGDGRWLGRGWLVEGAKTTEQVTLVRARRVPTSEVGAGQLGVRIAVAELPKQEGAAFEQAERAIRAYERADVPPHGSPTLDYVKQRSEWAESAALRTAGGQVYALSAHGTYVCQGPNRALLVVQRGASTGGDGLYAELWPTSW